MESLETSGLGLRKPDHIATLDGLRGVAILLVLFDHSTEQVFHRGELIFTVTRVGSIGVGLFFALSGFLITSRLLREQDSTGRISLRNFYIRRAFRLLPASFTYLSLLILLTMLGVISVTKQEILASVFFFRNYILTNNPSGGQWFTGHFWSLAIEEHFYFIWPTLLILLSRLKKGFAPATALLALCFAAWRWVEIEYNVIDISVSLFPARTDVRLDALFWGCFFAILASRDDVAWNWLKLNYKWQYCILLLALDVAGNLSNGRHNYSWYEPLILALLLIWPVLNPTSLLGKTLGTRLLTWAGALSYSLYIFQQLFLVFDYSPHPLGLFNHLPLNLAGVFIAAFVSYRFIEKPMIKRGHAITTLVPRSATLAEETVKM